MLALLTLHLSSLALLSPSRLLTPTRSLVAARSGPPHLQRRAQCVVLSQEQGDGHGEEHNATVVKMLVYYAANGNQWAVIGDVNKTAALEWLRIEGVHDDDTNEAELRSEELQLGNRAAHRRIFRLWRENRLLVRGTRLSDLELYGRRHAEVLASTQPARSARLTARAFRHELIGNIRRARSLYHPTRAERREILDFVRANSGIDLGALRAPRRFGTQPKEAPQEQPQAVLARWKELLEWFRRTFPYNRFECDACGEVGDLLGNVRPSHTDRNVKTSAASRTELQLCGVCGSLTRFSRCNHVGRILRNRKGRCGEYAQVWLRLVRALGWRARFVVDWTDHLWVEVLLPVGEAKREGAHEEEENDDEGLFEMDGVLHRWVHMDPCEAAVDEPGIYASWGKTHDYVIAIGDGQIVDRTRAYARDWDATIEARDMSEATLQRALRRVRLLCRAPK